MADGSDESGDDMVAGRINRAEDHTRIWAQLKNSQPFKGDVIFAAEGALNFEEDDDILDILDPDEFGPVSGRLHAILGSGVSEGVGVIGLDGSNSDHDISDLANVGVFGKGETGVKGEGVRGPGVEGIGQNRPLQSRLGVGVVGRGGRQPDANNEEREAHGPGVIGIGGGRSKQLKHEHILDGVGVFGQGAEAEERKVDGTAHGPLAPGIGVVGRGGIPIGQDVPVAPGVFGLAGGNDVFLDPSHSVIGDIGVVGVGATGVEGRGQGGPGVLGNGSGLPNSSDGVGAGVVGKGGSGLDLIGKPINGAGIIGVAGSAPEPVPHTTFETGVYGAGRDGVKGNGSQGRGGIFQSDRSAQVQLIPAKRSPQGTDQTSFTPIVIANAGSLLPRDGRGGDLMSLIDPGEQCSLWFCVQGGTTVSPARWAQVLLGPAFDGTA